ncbi:MAG TPA: hypothetical protein VMS04_11025 [Vicinamibacterales bacterium]|jgi:hypothetical protein|nr:hypothetical protein [Vicinamibacterales bacterium]
MAYKVKVQLLDRDGMKVDCGAYIVASPEEAEAEVRRRYRGMFARMQTHQWQVVTTILGETRQPVGQVPQVKL